MPFIGATFKLKCEQEQFIKICFAWELRIRIRLRNAPMHKLGKIEGNYKAYFGVRACLTHSARRPASRARPYTQSRGGGWSVESQYWPEYKWALPLTPSVGRKCLLPTTDAIPGSHIPYLHADQKRWDGKTKIWGNVVGVAVSTIYRIDVKQIWLLNMFHYFLIFLLWILLDEQV